jgi:hypothetical protein
MCAGAVKQNAPKSLLLAVCRDARPTLEEAGRHVDMIGRGPLLLGGGRARWWCFRWACYDAARQLPQNSAGDRQHTERAASRVPDCGPRISTATAVKLRPSACPPLLAFHAASSKTDHARGGGHRRPISSTCWVNCTRKIVPIIPSQECICNARAQLICSVFGADSQLDKSLLAGTIRSSSRLGATDEHRRHVPLAVRVLRNLAETQSAAHRLLVMPPSHRVSNIDTAIRLWSVEHENT